MPAEVAVSADSYTEALRVDVFDLIRLDFLVSADLRQLGHMLVFFVVGSSFKWGVEMQRSVLH